MARSHISFGFCTYYGMVPWLPPALRRNPAFAAIAIGALALVMGLSTTIFGIVDGLLYPTYPVREQEQLYRIAFFPSPSLVRNGTELNEIRRNAIELMAKRAAFFEGITADQFGGPEGGIEYNGQTVRVGYGRWVDHGYFQLLGMRAAHGRLFRPEEFDVDETFAVISDRLWRRLGSPGADGFRPFTVRNADRVITIIGVMERGAEGATRADLVTPVPARFRGQAGDLVRAKTGYTQEQIVAELARLNAAIAASLGAKPSESGFIVKSFTRTAPPAQRLYLALIASAIAILIIAGANLANVQLARGMARRGEMAVRMAMGASRQDIVRLITWESAQLALIGAVAGVILSVWGMRLAVLALPEGIPGFGMVIPQISWRVLTYAGVAALLCTATVGLLPAITLSRFDLTHAIKWGGGGGMVRARNRRYGALVVAQIAVSLGLGAGAALVADAAIALHTLDFGYDIRPLAGIALRAPGHWRVASMTPEQAIADLRSVSGVESATLFRHFRHDSGQVTVESGFGDQQLFHMPIGSTLGHWVTPDFFRTLGVRVTKGEDFTSTDDVPAVIVDSIAAAQIWRGANPVGKLIRLGGTHSKRPFVRVVGVVPHLRWDIGQYGERELGLQVYYIGKTLGTQRGSFLFANGLVRGRDGGAVASDVRNQVGSYIYFAASWSEYVGLTRVIESHDILALLFGGLAVLALLLAATGVYSVVAYSVVRRRREMGVRMALGATRERIFMMVLSEENLTTLVGLALGLLCAEWGLGLISETIFETAPKQQMLVMIGATVGMFVVALAAAGVPGLRASRVSPAESLRAD